MRLGEAKPSFHKERPWTAAAAIALTTPGPGDSIWSEDLPSERTPPSNTCYRTTRTLGHFARPENHMARSAVVIGLTGGVGSGKSTATLLFQEMGARVIDADAITHRLLDRPAVRRTLLRAFGREVVRNGRIDRAAVARRAFRDAVSVRRLNSAVHPFVRREIRRRLTQLRRSGKPIVLDAALLLETGANKLCDTLVFVDAPRAIRVRRVASRGWSDRELRRRERAQWPVRRKRARSDHVVRNKGNLRMLKTEVGKVLKAIRQEDS